MSKLNWIRSQRSLPTQGVVEPLLFCVELPTFNVTNSAPANKISSTERLLLQQPPEALILYVRGQVKVVVGALLWWRRLIYDVDLPAAAVNDADNRSAGAADYKSHVNSLAIVIKRQAYFSS